VLAYLMRFKQICNHPSQWLGDGGWQPRPTAASSARLRELAEVIAAKQEKLLVFTQFRGDHGAAGGLPGACSGARGWCCTAARL
jgi:SNF2 family DNA or RNA helicase